MWKKISPVVVVGLILTVTCVFLYINNNDFIQAITNYSYDLLLKEVHDPPKTDKVVIIDIDDASLESIGQWPWSRYVVAQLNDKLLEAGSSVVVYDIVFAEKDRTSPQMITSNLKQFMDLDVKFTGLPKEMEDYDLILAESLKKGNTILGCMMTPCDYFPENVDYSKDPYWKSFYSVKDNGLNHVNASLMQASDIMIGVPELIKSSKTAFFNAVIDLDSVVRSNPLIWAYGKDRIYPSLSLLAVMLHKGTPKCKIEYDENGVTGIRMRDSFIPTTREGRIVVNYRTVNESATGFFSSFPTYSALDILSEKIGKEKLEGKIVFIGTSAVGLKDLRAIPLTQHFSGVEVHATMVDNILAGDMLSRPSWIVGVDALSILIIGVFITLLVNRGRSWLSFVVSITVIVALMKVALVLLEKWHFVFVPSWVIISIMIIYPTLTMIKFWQEEYQRKKVRNMFGTMVSKDVLRFLETNPESFSLSGRRADATMMFSDVAGFTTISESLDPAKLSELLNKYLSPMTKIIMDRNGYVDKYEGDAIMAEWGVPFPLNDHAVQACHAALEQQKKLAEIRDELKAQYGHELYVRMGINSGVVTAGNMGSEGRFQYTVMGDAVNLSARLEPANKDYGTSIMIGENTHALVKDSFVTRQLDRIVVKGKTVPIAIYELVAVRGMCSEAKGNVIALYEQGLKLHWEQKWSESIEAFTQALKLDGGDKPSINMLNRVMYYQQVPPGEGWGGEFVRFSKD